MALAQPPMDIPVPAIPPGPAGNPLCVPYIFQGVGTNWCWAACAAMVLNYYNQNVTLCGVAGFLSPGIDCCQSPFLCNKGCSADDVQRLYASRGFDSNPTGGPVSAQDLQTEINNGRPVEVGFDSCPGGIETMGHLVLVYGYAPDGSFWVRDPMAPIGSGTIAYSQIVASVNYGCWRQTWVGIQPHNPMLREVVCGAQSSTHTSPA